MGDFTVVHSNGFLSAKDVCRFFGISESTLRDWEKKGNVRSVSVHGLRKYHVNEIDVLFKSMAKKSQTNRLFPDTFYWTYEDPRTGRPIGSWQDYLSRFPFMERVFGDISSHPYSVDKLDHYEFHLVKRPFSPLANHAVEFAAKNDHPLIVEHGNKCEVFPLVFDVYFDTIDAHPAGKQDIRNQAFILDYARVDPFFVSCCFDPHS